MNGTALIALGVPCAAAMVENGRAAGWPSWGGKKVDVLLDSIVVVVTLGAAG